MSVYKKSLHSFFLRVHPDFFARSNPEWQKTNEQSIAKLNELLDWAKQYKQGTKRSPPDLRISFKFYRRPEHDTPSDLSNADDEGSASAASSANQSLPSHLTAQFELPKSFSINAASSSALVERSVNKFLRDLLRKAGCLDNVASAASSAQDERLAREETMATAKPRSKRAVQKKPKVQTLMDAASQAVDETVLSGSSRFLCPSVEELIQEDQLLFSRDLTPLECAAATQRLAQLLPEMRYEDWMHVPLVFTRRPFHYEVGSEISGTMTIPWDFELYPFLQFLRIDGAKIRDAREVLQETARRLETMMSDICRMCDFHDVLITCTHRQAIPFLELFIKHAEEYHMMGIKGVTLEIGEHFAFRENGVIVVDHKCLDAGKLRDKMQKFVTIMPQLQLRYDTAKKLLGEIQYYKERFVEDVRPGGIDVETSGENYSERLEWMKELAKIAPQLAQFDWSDVKFALGPLSLDWENRLLTLPADFDGANFVRYLEDVRQKRKENEEKELSEYEALRKHADSLNELSNAKKFTTDVVNNNDDDFINAAEGKSVAKKKQQGQQKAAFDGRWREEYLVSSTGSSKARGDVQNEDTDYHELLTERPLAPDLNSMETEQDATEHLEWEGFYNKRRAVVTTDRDEEELQEAFLATNEKHRQKAIRDTIKELDEKYGLSENRYRKMTMGDTLGINNPQVAPDRYPKLAKGAYPGDNPK